MTTYTNANGSKAVHVTITFAGSFLVNYVQRHKDNFTGRVEEQVLQTKTFATIRSAERWANKMLS